MRKLFILALCFLSAAIYAGGPVYTCDFEDEAERSQWVLNPAPNAQRLADLKNLWYIGEPGNYSENGSNGLYISSDNGATTSYNADKAMWVLAYRSLTLPKGELNLYFDWQALGKPTNSDGIYLFWIPDADNITINSGNGAYLPAVLKNYQIDSISFTHALSWQYATEQFTTDGTPGRLVILWYNSSGQAYNPSGCIDNIEIHEKNDCRQPTGIKHTSKNGVVTLTWGGTADYYSIRSYDANLKRWHVYENQKDKRLDIHDLSEGVHTFFIRSHCGDDMSAYAIYTPFIVFEGTRCIDYMTLNNKNCFISTLPYNKDADFRPSYVDQGYASIISRHTIHYMQDEYDPRTNYHLKTIPPGELASVRLGNWDVNNETERIEYKLHVEEGESDILKIKYAIVMNTPDDYHPEVQQAHFTLSILANNKIVNPDCNSADFSCGYGDMTGWTDELTEAGRVLWKQWTEISLSLRNFVGQDISIRLTTTDCAQGGHYGYAYFTLGCESGELQGLTCGEANTAFTAPDGFNYRWYKADESDKILSTSQTFHIEPTDTFLYVCDVINPTLKSGVECYYQLEAIGLPRFPVAQATYTDVPVECQHLLTFDNQSYVRMFNDQRKDNKDITTTQKIDDFVWDFGDGTTLSTADHYVKHNYPTTGGDYDVKLYAYMGNRKCVDSLVIPLHLKDISVLEYHIDKHICEGQQYTYNGKTYFNTFSDTTVYRVGGGCDSVVVFNLYMHEDKTSYVKDTLCAREIPYSFFDGKDTVIITQSGIHNGRWPHWYSEECSCDSIAQVEFYIEPALEMSIADTMFVCPTENTDFGVDYTLLSGRMDSIYLLFDTEAQAAGFESRYGFERNEPISIPLPADIRVGRYIATMQFLTPFCVADEHEVIIEIGYPATVLDQKVGNGWVGVLQEANNEYGFTSYQWYRDGKPIENGNDAYMPINSQDVGHVYSVVLKREGDDEGLMSCPIVVSTTTDIDSYSLPDRPLKILYRGQILIRHDDGWYDVLGRKVNM